jgi:hypothetical protein
MKITFKLMMKKIQKEINLVHLEKINSLND